MDCGGYRYLLAIAILSTLYTGFQTLKDFHEISTGRQTFYPQNAARLDFFADQVCIFSVQAPCPCHLIHFISL